MQQGVHLQTLPGLGTWNIIFLAVVFIFLSSNVVLSQRSSISIFFLFITLIISLFLFFFLSLPVLNLIFPLLTTLPFLQQALICNRGESYKIFAIFIKH